MEVEEGGPVLISLFNVTLLYFRVKGEFYTFINGFGVIEDRTYGISYVEGTRRGDGAF